MSSRKFIYCVGLYIITVLVVSCSKDDKRLGRIPFSYSSDFPSRDRTVLLRENFDSTGSWTFGAVGLDAFDCNFPDTNHPSIAGIDTGHLVLYPRAYNTYNDSATHLLFAWNTLKNLNLADQPYGIEIRFREYHYDWPWGTYPLPNSYFYFNLNGYTIKPPHSSNSSSMTIKNRSLNICIKGDTILGVEITPFDSTYIPRENVIIEKSGEKENSVYFSSMRLYNPSAGNGGCPFQNTVVDYFEIYKFK